MRFRNREPLVSVLIETGLNLLDSLRDRLPDNVDDIRERVRDTYGAASGSRYVVPRTPFAARKIPRYSAKPWLLRLEWGLASESVC